MPHQFITFHRQRVIKSAHRIVKKCGGILKRNIANYLCFTCTQLENDNEESTWSTMSSENGHLVSALGSPRDALYMHIISRLMSLKVYLHRIDRDGARWLGIVVQGSTVHSIAILAFYLCLLSYWLKGFALDHEWWDFKSGVNKYNWIALIIFLSVCWAALRRMALEATSKHQGLRQGRRGDIWEEQCLSLN